MISPASIIRILGVPVHSTSMTNAVEIVVESARERTFSHCAFVNAHCLNVAVEDPKYRDALERVPWVFPDGSGVRYASKLLGRPVIDNVNGTDMYPLLCERLEQEGLSVFYLGGQPGITEEVVRRTKIKYPNLRIAGHHHGFFDGNEAQIVEQIANANADVLLVALGVPRQELWIEQHQHALNVGVALGVGGLFDFVAEKFERAPKLLRDLGLEWTYRLYQ
ncbi:MAG: WecB/TagA/CpsF family glycosyltransferase, partial [Gammaproteobacteria bacterium]|nr:WecB/TagA/CpsF family glycosyltransferase [Gammaproteobacteria bacterium]